MKILYVTSYAAYGDLMVVNGIVNFLTSFYDKIILFMDYNLENNDKVYSKLFGHNSKVMLMSFDYFMNNGSNFDHSNDDVDFLYLLQPEHWASSCQKDNTLIGQRGYTVCGTDFLKRIKPKNTFSSFINPIGDHLKLKYDENRYQEYILNDATCFCLRSKIPPEIFHTNFNYERCYEEEEKLFDSLNLPDEYSVICEYGDYKVNRDYITCDHIVNLHKLSNFFDVVKVIEEATEIHLIPNSICALVYYLQVSSRIKRKKVFYNVNARMEVESSFSCDNNFIIKFYENLVSNPKLDNWSFV